MGEVDQLATSDSIDVDRLAEEARASEHGEAYRAMAKSEDYRIGIGARVNGGLSSTSLRSWFR